MEASEIANSGSQFISKAKEAFAFPEKTCHYDKPTDESGSSKYRHILLYRNKDNPHVIEILNAYQPCRLRL